MKIFNPIQVINSLDGEDVEKSGRTSLAPIIPHGLNCVQVAILKEVFAAGGSIGGAPLVGKVFGEHTPFVKTDHIYEECLNLSRDWVNRYLLLEAEGSGSPYTSTVFDPWENRFTLTPIGKLMRDACDGHAPEFPHLLVNGISGRGANIPPHTLEGIVACIGAVLKNPSLSDLEMAALIGYPDFPSGCRVDSEESSLVHIYEAKKCRVKQQAKIVTVETEDGFEMTITGLPSGVSPETVIEEILNHEKDIQGLRRIVNETAEHPRVVLTLSPNSDVLEIERVIMAEFGCQKDEACKMNVVSRAGVMAEMSTGAMLKEYVNDRVEFIAARDDIGGAAAAAKLLSELRDIQSNLGKDRNCEVATLVQVDVEKSPDPMVVVLTARGVIRRIPAASWKQQGRGGKGVDSMPIQSANAERDTLSMIACGANNQTLLLATTKGRVFFRKIGSIAGGKADAMGELVNHFLNTDKSEGVTALSVIDRINSANTLVVVTAHGSIKGLSMSKFATAKKGGRAAISLREGDRVVALLDVPTDHDIALLTSKGNLARLRSNGIGDSSPATKGIPAMVLQDGETIVDACVLPLNEDVYLLTGNENGNGKLTRAGEFTAQGLGTATGYLIIKGEDSLAKDCFIVGLEDEIFAGSREGRVLRFAAKDITPTGRGGIGVILVSMSSSRDALAGVAVLSSGRSKAIPLEESLAPSDSAEEIALEGRSYSENSLSQGQPSPSELEVLEGRVADEVNELGEREEREESRREEREDEDRDLEESAPEGSPEGEEQTERSPEKLPGENDLGEPVRSEGDDDALPGRENDYPRQPSSPEL